MSELNKLRTIPSRSYSVPFQSNQKLREFPSGAWLPTFKFNGNAIDVTFGAGTVNGFLPTNWNESFSIPQSSPRYVKLFVTGTIDGISKVEIKVEPSLTTTNDFKKQTPSTNFSFIIGVVNGTDYSMVFNSGINVYPIEAFKIEKTTAPQEGKDPFDRYWGWAVASN
jgi:hypothetical protein